MPLLTLACACLVASPVQIKTSKDRIDAKEVLNAFYEKMHDAPTAKGVIVRRGEQKIDFRIMRPNLFLMQSPELDVRGDGKTMVMKMKGHKEPMRFRQAVGAPFIYGFESLTTDARPDYIRAGKARAGFFRGQAAYLVPMEGDPSAEDEGVTLYIDRETLLPIGCEFAAKGKSEFLVYRDVVLGATMKRSDFALKP